MTIQSALLTCYGAEARLLDTVASPVFTDWVYQTPAPTIFNLYL